MGKESNEISLAIQGCQQKQKGLVEVAYGRKVSQEDIEGCKKEIEQVCDHCETSIKLKRNTERPVVSSWR